MERIKIIKRKTNETEIEIELNIDGCGDSNINTPVPFLNHVLSSFARHGFFDLRVKATGDVEVDPHHIIEDIGICLGKAVAECIGDKKGINRFGFVIIPMDETEVTISLDLGGRPYLRYSVEILNEKIENMSTMLVRDFFKALVDNSSMNLHINKNVGVNSHHIIEAVFKAFGIALKQAVRKGSGTLIPSTKGML
jgi:imidazoleglycerol-phosphate dehydratase